MLKNSKTESYSNDVDIETGEKHVAFFDVFANAMVFLLAVVLVYSVVYTAFFKPKTQSTNIMLDSLFTTDTVTVGSKNDPPPSSQDANSVTTGGNKETPTGDKAAVPGVTSTTKPANQIPKTTAEIASYYRTAVNKVKKSAKSVICPWKITTNYKGIVETGNSDFLANTIKSLMNAYMKEETSDKPFTSRQDIIQNFPPRGGNSNLKSSDIKTASCTEKDGYYYIVLETNPENDPKPGYGIASVFNIMDEKDITEKSPVKISNLHYAYDSGRLEAKIEKKTGNMVSLSTKLPTVMQLSALGVDCKLGLEFEEKWQITW